MDFVALDFETANADLSSICQVGLVVFRNGEVAETISSLVDPDDHFDPVNSAIHGITEAKIVGAPRFPTIHGRICERLQRNVVVCHSMFDRAALDQASRRHGLPAAARR
jgi:DNA polymerase-3 subunit epsilon